MTSNRKYLKRMENLKFSSSIAFLNNFKKAIENDDDFNYLFIESGKSYTFISGNDKTNTVITRYDFVEFVGKIINSVMDDKILSYIKNNYTFEK